MKKVLNIKKLITVILLLLTVFILIFLKINKDTKNFSKKETKIEKKLIVEQTELFNINIEYPHFNNDTTDLKIKEFLDKQIKQLKNFKNGGDLNISYNLDKIKDFDYLVFKIKNSSDEHMIYKAYLLKNKKFESFENIFDLEKIKEKSLEYVKNRYSKEIYESISNMDYSKSNYLINDRDIIIYLYELKTTKMSYVPEIKIKTDDLDFKDSFTIKRNYEFPLIKKTKYIALTFDDGPSLVTTEILDILETYNASATFFSLGGRMNQYKNVIKKEYDFGHQVASHAYTHKNFTSLNETEILSQINKTNKVYNSITADKNKLVFRPPYGFYNKKVRALVDAPFILWNIDTTDWKRLDNKTIANIVIKKAFNGGIVLMHDLYFETKESLKIILPELEAQGYKFITINQMAKEFKVTLLPGEVYIYIK